MYRASLCLEALVGAKDCLEIIAASNSNTCAALFLSKAVWTFNSRLQADDLI